MNLKVFLFKLSVIAWHIAILTLIYLPFTLAVIALRETRVKYGFSFFELSFSTALFIAFALALGVGCYNALVFEKFRNIPLAAYLKSMQKVKLVKGVNRREIQLAIERLLQKPRWKMLSSGENEIILTRKSVPANSIITAQNREGQWTIRSTPKYRFWFIDFGRNYKNIMLLVKSIDQTK